ncbi:MAG TPA: T9SS type A sorting domain-containing protein [Flavobacteriales bacterium]|nr:T9SS type A sorting domain-containing protein [Flavobacteriales bacterium]
MKKLFATMLVIGIPASSTAQFWAPGACWTYHDLAGLNAERFLYVRDSVIDGMDVQVCRWEICGISPPGVYNCGNFNGPYYEFITTQGEAVLSRVYPLSTSWDTLYWLGVPGDRWWPRNSEPYCLGYAGMLQIQDTGHVVIQGVELRTWEVVRLSESGAPFLGWSVTITERIGAAPRNFCPWLCSVIVDCYDYQLVHYSDDEIAIPPGASCAMAMGHPVNQLMSDWRTLPNPGSDELRVTGRIAAATRVEVCDALGRLIVGQALLRNEIPITISTSAWEPGTYFVTLIEHSGQRQVLRWLKE